MDSLSASQLVGAGVATAVTLGSALYYLMTRPAKAAGLPSTMRQLLLKKHVDPSPETSLDELRAALQVEEVPMPKLRSGQVLVRMERSPINPSDLSTMQGSYNAKQRKPLPCGVGYEMSGTVVAAGGGYMARRLMGKRVAAASTGGGCTYAEYVAAPAMTCMVLPGDVSFEEGCSCFVNPLTAIGFLEVNAAAKCRTIVHTAAASSLGKMLVRLAKRKGVRVIGVVRREAQREELMALGALDVVVTSSDDWDDRLKELCATHDARVCFDAVAGPDTGRILAAMPPKSKLYVYGGLSKQGCGNIRPTDLIFRGSQVAGFWLTPHLMSKNLLGKVAMLGQVTKYLKTDLATAVRKTYTLEDAADAVHDYVTNMTAGKICFTGTK